MTTASSPSKSTRSVSLTGYLIASPGPVTEVDGLRKITGSAGGPLPQQVPALVQRLLGGAQSLALLLAGQLTGRELPTELMLGVDQLVNVSHDLLVVHAPTVNPCPPYCGPGSVI